MGGEELREQRVRVTKDAAMATANDSPPSNAAVLEAATRLLAWGGFGAAGPLYDGVTVDLRLVAEFTLAHGSAGAVG